MPSRDAGEHVEQRGGRSARRVAHVVGGDDRHAVRVGEVGEPAREPLAVALAMAMHVDGEPLGEDAAQSVEMRGGVGAGERPVRAAGETEQSPRRAPRPAPTSPRASPFGASARGRGEEPAEVRVAGAILDQ